MTDDSAPFAEIKRLASQAEERIFGLMTKVWKIISSTPRMGGGGPPLKQYFLVATSNQSAALKALRYRRPDVGASQLTVAGETNTDNLEWQWLDLREGQILVLDAVS
jgi:hypothetical protein